MRVHTDAKLERRRQQRESLGTRPVPARGGASVLGGKRRFADTGVAAHTSRIFIDSEIAHEAHKTIPTKRNSVVISIVRKVKNVGMGVENTLRTFEDFQVEYSSAISQTATRSRGVLHLSNVFGAVTPPALN